MATRGPRPIWPFASTRRGFSEAIRTCCSTAAVTVTEQPGGEKIARETSGSRMAYVPYTIPGFALAKSVADIFDANRNVQGLILLRHGIFPFAEDARTAYELMIEMATLAEG